MKHYTELHEKEIKKEINFYNSKYIYHPIVLIYFVYFQYFYPFQTSVTIMLLPWFLQHTCCRIYKKKHIEIHTTRVTSELKTTLTNTILTLSLEIRAWIPTVTAMFSSVCGVSTLSVVIIFKIFFTEVKSSCKILKFYWPGTSQSHHWQPSAIENFKNL